MRNMADGFIAELIVGRRADLVEQEQVQVKGVHVHLVAF